MIAVLFFFVGLCGGAVGILLAGAWFGAALLFGFTPPTGDQAGGLVVLFATGGTLGSALIAGVVLLVEG